MKKLFILIPLILLLCLTFNCKKAEEGITEEEAKAIHEIYVKARNTVNLDLLDEICAESIVVHDSGYPETIVGLDALKDYYSNNHKAFPDLQITFNEMIVKGDRIVVFWTFSGTNTGPLHTPMGDIPATGRNVQFFGIAIDRVEEGKIVEDWVVWNVLDLMMQLGFTINPPQLPEQTAERK
jgi:predicted ester cyclase